MLDAHLVRAFAALTLAASLSGATAIPTAAFVIYEPTREPAPESWPAEVPVSVPWAGVSMHIPTEWTAKVKREPGVEVNGASLLVAFGPGESLCLLDYYLAGTVETWQDVGVRPSHTLSIDGHPAERFDDMLGTGAKTASAYSIDAGERVYAMLCSADRAPADRWHSIAASITVP